MLTDSGLPPKDGAAPYMTAPAEIQLHFASTDMSVRQALIRLLAQLARHVPDQDDLGRVEIVVAEALNNVVEHAYCSAGMGPVDLRCRFGCGRLFVTIGDEGVPVPQAILVPEVVQAPLPLPEELPEGGWGWMLIRELTENLSYHRVGGRNELTLEMLVSISDS